MPNPRSSATYGMRYGETATDNTDEKGGTLCIISECIPDVPLSLGGVLHGARYANNELILDTVQPTLESPPTVNAESPALTSHARAREPVTGRQTLSSIAEISPFAPDDAVEAAQDDIPPSFSRRRDSSATVHEELVRRALSPESTYDYPLSYVLPAGRAPTPVTPDEVSDEQQKHWGEIEAAIEVLIAEMETSFASQQLHESTLHVSARCAPRPPVQAARYRYTYLDIDSPSTRGYHYSYFGEIIDTPDTPSKLLKTKWIVVTIGLRVGVFKGWDRAAPYVEGIPAAKTRDFRSYRAALKHYSLIKAARGVAILQRC
ncbi:hypothetical protein C8Q73DRAFT_794575 [Cubamyces lactineus]|nr:hypothetical protein C8Q73DRAFT_794559 [Cubamyces lactineus]KAH9887569.1 hypothetical protein C8Q73DRAFT_794575 [Cubamyces lactineus]